jgi:hypothetical protein
MLQFLPIRIRPLLRLRKGISNAEVKAMRSRLIETLKAPNAGEDSSLEKNIDDVRVP